MRVLITGAAGNLGSRLARHLAPRGLGLDLLIHRKELPPGLADLPGVRVYRGDLEEPPTLVESCRGADCVVHCAGVLFAPHPERFLPRTNVEYVRNLVAIALAEGVKRFILISFPHVEGESTPELRAAGRLEGSPGSVHAQTRLAAEKHLFLVTQGTNMTPIALRPGMIYGSGVLMIEAARRLLQRRRLAVWPQATWIHLLALPDFLACVEAAILRPRVQGVYGLGDDEPLTLQEFLDTVARHWGCRPPWRCPRWSFLLAAICCEAFATLFRTAAPLTRDFIRIGMASYCADTARMKQELLPRLAYPTLKDGLRLL